MSRGVDFETIRPLDGSQRKGFEELCCQLARLWTQEHTESAQFKVKGDPDAGVECYAIPDDGSIIGWQAKYFNTPPSSEQLEQVTKSFKTALKKHPQLSQYIVCIPVDRADPRIDDRTDYMERWETKVESWEQYASDEGRDIDIKYWGYSELIDLLSHDALRGRQYFWFNEEGLTEQFIRNFAEEQFQNATQRYQEPSVHLPVERAFHALGLHPEFKEHLHRLADNLENAVMSWKDNLNDEFSATTAAFLYEAYDIIRILREDRRSFEAIPKEELRTKISRLSKMYGEILMVRSDDFAMSKDQFSSQLDSQDSTDKFQSQNEKQLKSSTYFSDSNTITQLERQIHGGLFTLVNKQQLCVTGDAGVGKTHLFCKITDERTNRGGPTLLFLGEHFGEGQIWPQICEQVDLDLNTADELLGALDAFGEVSDERSLILIDGINESEPNKIWSQQLPGVLQKVDKYDNVGIAISYRTEYRQDVEPRGGFPDSLHFVEHHGFTGREAKAAESYFEEYDLEIGSIPVLRPEFQRPLFLRLYCEAIQNQNKDKVPEGRQGISWIFENYLSNINDRLSRKPRLSYRRDDELVQEAVGNLAELMATRSSKAVPLDEARPIINNSLPGRQYPDTLYEALQREDILDEGTRTEVNSQIEIVRFQYERFSDHYIVDYLLGEHLDDDPIAAINSNEQLRKALEGDSGLYLPTALAVQFPEWTGIELFEATSVEDEPIIRSFPWRDPASLIEDGELKDEIADFISDLPDSALETLFDTLISLVSIHDHPLGAEFLHSKLLENQSFRHSWFEFVSGLPDRNHILQTLIRWVFTSDYVERLSPEDRLRYGLVLSWSLGVSDRGVRNYVTRALVRLLESQSESVLQSLLDRFEECEDALIINRLYAVLYGIVLREERTLSDQVVQRVLTQFTESSQAQTLLGADYVCGITSPGSISDSNRFTSDPELNTTSSDTITADSNYDVLPDLMSFVLPDSVENPQEKASDILEEIRDSPEEYLPGDIPLLIDPSIEVAPKSRTLQFLLVETTIIPAYTELTESELFGKILHRLIEKGWQVGVKVNKSRGYNSSKYSYPNDYQIFNENISYAGNKTKMLEKHLWEAFQIELYCDAVNQDISPQKYAIETGLRDIDPSLRLDIENNLIADVSLDFKPEATISFNTSMVSDSLDIEDIPAMSLFQDNEGVLFAGHQTLNVNQGDTTDTWNMEKISLLVPSDKIGTQSVEIPDHTLTGDGEDFRDWLPKLHGVFANEYPDILKSNNVDAISYPHEEPETGAQTTLQYQWNPNNNFPDILGRSHLLPTPELMEVLDLSRVQDEFFFDGFGSIQVSDLYVGDSSGATPTGLYGYPRDAVYQRLRGAGYELCWLINAIPTDRLGETNSLPVVRSVCYQEDGEIRSASEII